MARTAKKETHLLVGLWLCLRLLQLLLLPEGGSAVVAQRLPQRALLAVVGPAAAAAAGLMHGCLCLAPAADADAAVSAVLA